MISPRRLVGAGIAVGGLLVISLAGCTPVTEPDASSGHAPGPSASVTPTPTPTATGLPAGALLRVSAVAVSDTGASVRIVETVSGPVVGDGSEDAAMTAAQCSGDGYTWQTDFPGTPQWLHLDMTATAVGGPAWPTDDDHQIFLTGASGWDTVAWSGSWHHAQAACASGYAVIPGHATGVAPVVGDADARTSWQTGRFGFGWDWGERDDVPPNLKVDLQDCRIELSTEAQAVASRFVREASQPGYGQACLFGSESD
jgi:hypothetical protein